ncbi:MAG TPA: hypothetical protein V6D29_09445 [Leptolyngbyaceae cyanobacterium]
MTVTMPVETFANREGEEFTLTIDGSQFVLKGSEVDSAARDGGEGPYHNEGGGHYSLRWPIETKIAELLTSPSIGSSAGGAVQPLVFLGSFIIRLEEVLKLNTAAEALKSKA